MDQMPEELLYAHLAIKFLQAAAQQLHSSTPAPPPPAATQEQQQQPVGPPAPPSRRATSINFVLSSLMLVRRLAKTALLAQAEPGCAHAAGTQDSAGAPAEPLTQLQERVAAVLDKLKSGGHLPPGSKLPQVDDIHKYKSAQQEAVLQEMSDLEAYWNQEGLAASDSGLTNLARLTRVIRQLHGVERGLAHQARVAAEVDSLCSSSSYTDDNFAYGTTPYATWHRVICQEPVAAKLKEGLTYMVWGSSLGWLLFYAAATFPGACVGYELLTSLTRVSEQVARDNGFTNVQVVAEDLQHSSLDGVSVLLLTNHCWDEELMDAAARKIAQELPAGAICIEYTGALQQVLGMPYSCIVSPVSWNPGQKLYTYIKQW